jgi:hypothetical protein
MLPQKTEILGKGRRTENPPKFILLDHSEIALQMALFAVMNETKQQMLQFYRKKVDNLAVPCSLCTSRKFYVVYSGWIFAVWLSKSRLIINAVYLVR